jgi:hypothetical protein
LDQENLDRSIKCCDCGGSWPDLECDAENCCCCFHSACINL